MELCKDCPDIWACGHSDECLRERAERVGDCVAASCSPGAEESVDTPVERRHSPVGDVLDELREKIDIEKDTRLTKWFDLEEDSVEAKNIVEQVDGLVWAWKLLTAERAKHGPSERSERRANDES